MLNKNAMKKTSQILVLAMLLMVFMPIAAFAASGFSGVTFDGKNVSATVYGETYSPNGVAVHVYGPDGTYVTSTTATYSTYNVTDSVYVYTFSNFNVTGSIYNTVTLEAPDVTGSVYTATYVAPGGGVTNPPPVVTPGDGGGDNGGATNPPEVTLSYIYFKAPNIDGKLIRHNLSVGISVYSEVYGLYSDSSKVAVTSFASYTSNDSAIASVDSKGKITAIAAGTTVINATYGAKSTSVEVVVLPILTSISLDSTSYSLSVGSSHTSTVIASFSNDATANVTPYTTYSSSQTSVATVASDGVVTAVSQGATVITATYHGKTATATVTVTSSSVDNGPGNGDDKKANGPSKEIEITVGSPVAKEALEKAFAGNDNVTISLKGDSASLNAAGLVEAAKKDGTSVTITSENGTYVLPLSLLKLDDLAKSLGIATADLNIKVSITKVSGTTATAVADGVKAIGATSLTDAIDFKVTAEGKDGKSVEINGFGSTYVSRSVEISKTVDMKKVTGVLYNEVTKKFSFVPATFETKDGKTVATLKRNGNSIYTVVEINKNFTDIASHWSKDDVSLLANKLVIDGATETTFAPDRNITRAEFAALVVRSLGLNTDATSTTFTDVKSSDWYAGAVAAAVGAKIINGYEDGSFNANAQITREELATMVVRALTFAGVKSDLSATQQATLLGKFTDAGQIAWADKEIAAAVDAGIINGLTNTTIGSSKQATRAEAATMLKRFLTKAGFIN